MKFNFAHLFVIFFLNKGTNFVGNKHTYKYTHTSLTGKHQRIVNKHRTSQGAVVVKNMPANAGDAQDSCSIPG